MTASRPDASEWWLYELDTNDVVFSPPDLAERRASSLVVDSNL
jgi:hypothetical protein